MIMSHTDILELAREVAAWLGIRIKDPALVLRNMKPSTGITTILYNEDYTLWIDKRYIAYSDNAKPEIVYVFTDTEHVKEELRSVIGRIKTEKSPYTLKTLTSVKEQLQLAGAGIGKSGDGLCFFESEDQAMIKRGDIYYADLNPVIGSEQGEQRPVLIVQNDTGNKYSPTVIITPITGRLNKPPLPTHVFIPKTCGLEKDSLVLTEQIRAIDRSRLGNYIGRAGKCVMPRVDMALSVSVGLYKKEDGGQLSYEE
jgi:mRNA interferase MazF